MSETGSSGAGSANTGFLDEVLILGRGFFDDGRPWVLEARRGSSPTCPAGTPTA